MSNTISPEHRLILTDEIYDLIKSQLMDHIILPGSRISIDGLARELGVSHTPIREAMARLEADELVIRKPLTGYSATSVLTWQAFTDLYDFRVLLEPHAIVNATNSLSVAGETLLKDELATCMSSPTGKSYSSYRAISEHDARFHQLILHLSGNSIMEAAFRKTHCHLHLFRLSSISSDGRNLALKEHAEIVKAMISRDANLAKAVMSDHLEKSRARMLPFILALSPETKVG